MEENFRLPPVGVLLKTVPYPRGNSTGFNKKPRLQDLAAFEIVKGGGGKGVGVGKPRQFS